MNLYILLILAVIFIAVSVIITAYIRNFSIKNNLFDIPNDRSAHKIPIPNLGGIAIIIPLIQQYYALSFTILGTVLLNLNNFFFLLN